MAKDPAFLFYPGDFTTGTQFFSNEQVGKYMRLLMAQHQHGHLPEKHMIFICGSYDKDIFSKFIQDSEGNWYNERLEFEVNKRKNYVDSRSKNKEGKTKEKIISKSYDSHMENENRNRSINVLNKIEPNTKLEIFESIFTDERFITDLSITHKGRDFKQAFEECWLYHSQTPSPPEHVWQWKQKLGTWLTIKSKNGSGQKFTDKGTAHTASLMEGYKQHYGKSSNGGEV